MASYSLDVKCPSTVSIDFAVPGEALKYYINQDAVYTFSEADIKIPACQTLLGYQLSSDGAGTFYAGDNTFFTYPYIGCTTNPCRELKIKT